jgi:hypothetical protein
MRAAVTLALLAACTGEAGLQEEHPDTASCELHAIPDRRMPGAELTMVLVVSDSASMAAYQPRLIENLERLGASSELESSGIRLVVVGGPDGCTNNGDADVRDIGLPWFACDEQPCRERNYDGALGDALACAGAVPADRFGPSALLDRLDTVLDDPAIVDPETFLDLVFVTTDDDASSADPTAYAARVRGAHPDGWSTEVFTIGDGATPRLDDFVWHLQLPHPAWQAPSIDDDDWLLEGGFAIAQLDIAGRGCMHELPPPPVEYTGVDFDGTPLPHCEMLTPDRPSPTTPLPCLRLTNDEPWACSDFDGDSAVVVVERRRWTWHDARVTYACDVDVQP